MKQKIQDFLKKEYQDINFDVSYPPEGFGDYSTNVAFLLATARRARPIRAKKIKENPKKIAKEVIGKLEKKFKEFEKIEAVGGGFINFYLSKKYLFERLDKFLKDKIELPKIKAQKINLEFISANPTGPLTLANGRGGFLGDVLANILVRVGHKVEREYYINDTGRQISILGFTVGKSVGYKFSSEYYSDDELYKGEYISDLAERFKKDEISKNPYLFPEQIGEWASKIILSWIRESLINIGIKFDNWFSEKDDLKIEDYQKIINMGLLEHREDGAYYFKNDESVLIRSVGIENIRKLKIGGVEHEYSTTYFFSDLVYHYDKFLKRNFDFCINIWGADHHGHVARLKSGVAALGISPDKLEIIITQFVRLVEEGKEVSMSKRKGQFVTLDDLVKEVGKDGARFFFLMVSPDTHMDFDLKLAKEQSSKNPVYYIQYAFARISSVFEKAGNKITSKDLELIKEKEELDLIRHLIRFPEVIFEISENYQVHHLPQYAFELANKFHKFYEKQRIISEDEKLTGARLSLVKAVQTILGESLTLMGLETPKRM